jgi:hypothetical protein
VLFTLSPHTAVWSRTVRRRSVKAHDAGSNPATAAARIRGWANGRPLGFEPGNVKVRLLLPVPCSTTFRGTFNGRTPRSERGSVGSIPAPGTFRTRNILRIEQPRPTITNSVWLSPHTSWCEDTINSRQADCRQVGFRWASLVLAPTLPGLELEQSQSGQPELEPRSASSLSALSSHRL